MSDMLLPIRRYADFRGRSGRREFWTFVLFVIVAEAILMTIDAALGFGRLDRDWYSYQWGLAGMADWNGGFLAPIFWLGVLIPSLAVAARRLHDVNRGGAWLLLALLPVFGWIVLLILHTQASWPVANKWGSPPA